jgi:hypothetical protein
MAALAHYQQVLDLSQRMLAAGMAQRWEELLALEAQRQTLLEQAPRATPSAPPPALLELIGEIQRCDALLTEKLEAWLTHARILLRMDAQPSPKT